MSWLREEGEVLLLLRRCLALLVRPPTIPFPLLSQNLFFGDTWQEGLAERRMAQERQRLAGEDRTRAGGHATSRPPVAAAGPSAPAAPAAAARSRGVQEGPAAAQPRSSREGSSDRERSTGSAARRTSSSKEQPPPQRPQQPPKSSLSSQLTRPFFPSHDP